MKRQKSELLLDTIQSKILPSLPAKSLGHFRCVCKQWKSLLSTQEFIKLHKPPNDEKFLILDSSRPATFYSIDCEHPHYPYPPTMLENVTCEVNPKHMLLLASLNGLVCVGFKNSRKLMIWNPLTGDYKYLSNSKYHGHAFVPRSDPIGFYKDSLDDCYKILHVLRTPGGSCRAYIYSQRFDTWKEIKFLENARFPEYDWSPVTFSKVSLYFTLKGGGFQGKRLIVISFVVNSEEFKEIQCPSGAIKCTRFAGRLVIIKDYIHLCVSYGMMRDSGWQSELDLWRLNGEEGWTQVESISLNDRYTLQCNYFWIPICILRNGDWLVLGDSDGSFYIIDMKTKELAHLYQCGWLTHEGLVNTIQRAMYIETLVSPQIHSSSEAPRSRSHARKFYKF